MFSSLVGANLMKQEQQCDLSIFRVWPQDGDMGSVRGDTSPVLERKMQMMDEAQRREDVTGLLNDMTLELKAHFQFFKMLRERSGGVLPEDEAGDGKLIRADMKAASDALSLIVRTLEKIDELQRQMVKERDLALDDEAESADYEQAVSFFLERIEALADEKFRQRCAEQKIR
jgi:hypothetical protein